MSTEEEMSREAVKEKALQLVGRIIDKPKQFPPPDGLKTYEPQDTDVVVTTFPKSGTTLTQQLTYQVVIATGGAGEKDPDGMSFEDLCEVAPFVDFGPKHGFVDYDSNPRVYKSHVTPSLFRSTVQKHVVVIRNPRSYPASALDFLFEGWAGEEVTNKMILEEVYHEFLAVRLLGLGEGFGFPFDKEDISHKDEKKENKDKLPVGPWFLHSKAWVGAMRPNTLFLFYEDIVADMGKAAKSIAKFIGRELDDAGLKQVIDRCDRTYMSNDPKFKCTMENKALGFAANAWKAKPKTRNGFKQFSPTEEEEEQIKLRFRQEFGVDTYDDFKAIVYEKQRELGVTE